MEEGATTQVDATEAPVAAKAPPAPLNLDILLTVKTFQLQHGLRHGDYQRYRQYCARKLRRLRQLEHFVHGKKFQKKEITPEIVTNVRFLLLVLMKAERAWGYAMQLKDELSSNSRAKVHMMKRFKKAYKAAQLLETLCNARADKKTILEAEAYSSWMGGNYHMEKENWQEALNQFARSKTIYEQLGKVAEFEHQQIFKQRLEDIEPSIRYCNYKNKGSDEKAAEKSPGMDDLQSKLDTVINEALKKQSQTTREIIWQGKKIPIRSEKLRVSILGSQETNFEIERADTFDAKMAAYDKAFVQYNDALNTIKDEITSVTTGAKFRSGKVEAQEEQLVQLRNYVTNQKLTKTIERNLLMVESIEGRLFAKDDQKRRSKPEDLVRVYETLIQNVNELEANNPTPSTEEEKEAKKENAARLLAFKAYRCFYLALSYLQAAKWPESLALLDRAGTEVKNAQVHYDDCKNPPKEDLQKLADISSKISGFKCETHAKGFLETLIKTQIQNDNEPSSSALVLAQSLNISTEELATFQAQKQKADNNNNPKPEEASTGGPTLLSKLHEFDYTPAENKQLISFPPDFEAVKCKTLLFDLALTELQFPSLEARKKPKSSGFWGFWSRS
mmetsp:Transcript_17659/g.24537  ORF Transcript_17659/g.24537 Transcript_17659/m.24537 type:complete len:617 (+) Transcript_17659:36-1886(+)